MRPSLERARAGGDLLRSMMRSGLLGTGVETLFMLDDLIRYVEESPLQLADLTPCSWTLAPGMAPVTLDKIACADGVELWGIHCGESVLSVDGVWLALPRPEKRDAAFRKRCRWATADEALAVWERMQNQKRAA